MIKKITIFLLIFLFLCSNVYATEDIYLDIGLTRPIKSRYSVNLSSYSGFGIYDFNDVFLFDIEDNEITVTFKNGFFNISNNFGQLIYQSNNFDGIIIKNAQFRDTPITVENMSYRGFIKFKNFNNSPVIINTIRMEDYLKGVVPSEMSASAHEEALKAQAVCSRSYAFANINKMISKGYNLDDTTNSQAYFGTQKETQKSSKAVDDTRGIVVRYNGEIANTIFFSTSSGKTENAEDVWGGSKPYLVSVNDPYSATSQYFNWSMNVSSSKLSEILSNNNIYIGNLKNITLELNPNSGSVKNVLFYGDYATGKLKASTLRTALISTKFRSTWFRIGEIGSDEEINYQSVSNYNQYTQINSFPFYIISDKETIKNNENIEKVILSKDDILWTNDLNSVNILGRTKNNTQNNNITHDDTIYNSDGTVYTTKSYNVGKNINFVGRGYGHGVGMPQYGAYELAARGSTYEDILKYYFKGVQIGF